MMISNLLYKQKNEPLKWFKQYSISTELNLYHTCHPCMSVYVFNATLIKNKEKVILFYLPLCSVGLGEPLRGYNKPWFKLNSESNLNWFINCPCITWLTLGLYIVSKTLCSMSAHIPQYGTIAIQCVYLYSICTTGQQWTNPPNMTLCFSSALKRVRGEDMECGRLIWSYSTCGSWGFYQIYQARLEDCELRPHGCLTPLQNLRSVTPDRMMIAHSPQQPHKQEEQSLMATGLFYSNYKINGNAMKNAEGFLSRFIDTDKTRWVK